MNQITKVKFDSPEWRKVDEYEVASPFIDVGFRRVKDVVDLRVFDLLNISRINNNRAEEMLLCIYHLLQPDRRIDEGIYYDEIDQYFSYREWKKKHQPLSGVTVRDKVKEYADEGYKYAVCLDLSKYFDTLNHELLMNMLREDIKDKRLIDLIKKYLKSGVMENGIVMKTKEGSPQGGNLSPLLANIYLNKFDKEYESRGVKVIRYADDILLLARSMRAAERLLGTSTAYLEKKLKLKVNTEKSRAVSVYSIRNFGFWALRWEGTERVHISEFTQSRRRKPRINCES